MIRTSWKCLLFGVVAAMFLASAPHADAQWWGYRPYAWGCCYGPRYVAPCYTPCYTSWCVPSCSPCITTVRYAAPCCDSGYYLGVRPGPIRRLLFGPYRWYWGGSCWSGCATYSAPCCGGDVVAPTQSPTPAPAQAPTPAKKPEAPASPLELNPQVTPAPSPLKTTATSAEQSGVLTVWVPFDAKVTINGQETRSTGSRRQFVSYDLKPGLSYRYVVKAQVVRNGQLVEDTKTVTMAAGDVTAVAFGFNANPTEQVAAAQ